jgi:hypothetical protein
MSIKMRAKLRLHTIETYSIFETQETLKFSAVCPKSFDPNGVPNDDEENNNFARWTPSADLVMSITNPNLIHKFKQGDEFYVDFTPVSNNT